MSQKLSPVEQKQSANEFAGIFQGSRTFYNSFEFVILTLATEWDMYIVSKSVYSTKKTALKIKHGLKNMNRKTRVKM